METTSNYTKQWSTANPGLLVPIIDFSGSMAESYPEGGTKANFVHRVVNRLINEMINANADGDSVKNRLFLSTIACSNPVREVCSGMLGDLANNPLRVETATQKVSDGNGGLVEVTVQNPIYFDSCAEGLTPMSSTLEAARQVGEGFINKYPDCPAPVFLIVTDGMPRAKGVDDSVEEANTIAMAQKIKELKSSDGNALIFVCHIGNGANRCEYPASESELPDDQARFLYKVASEIPETYKEAARKLEIDLSEHSKAMVSNADPTTFIKFINFGSSGAQQDKMSN